ncbi:MAG: PqqD family protein, partial [Desulfobacterales bacterium]
MSIDRPTFSESWYRVSELTPRLLGTVTVQRQHFRGVRWYVLQDPANNQYFRLNDAAYHFVAMFDGRRTVSQVWNICTERFGDAAPTQGEVIQLLCQLHASNLLQGNLAPDAEALFKRHQKRVWREVKGAVGNFLFVRIPLWDPDRFL